jgi:6,7-dimethyl-8-ribityllumazine synthase
LREAFMKKVERQLQPGVLKFAVIVSRFYEFITNKPLDLLRHGANADNIDIIRVPGSFEIPLAAKKIARKKSHDAIICLGTIIRGATPHFDYVASEAAKGIALVSLEAEIPLAFGVITADTIEQAIERAGTKSGNKGWDAALVAVEMAQLLKKL